MNMKELVISIFEKEFGPLNTVRERNYGDSSTCELEFIYKGEVSLKIFLMEAATNTWCIHHDLSKENPFLLKKTARVTERVRRIKQTNETLVFLSKDLIEINDELYIKTVMKSALQNFLCKHFTLFGEKKVKWPKSMNQMKEPGIGNFSDAIAK